MQDIDYAIALFNKFKIDHYDYNDEAEKFLAMMAYQEICADQRERFNYIISNNRFNEYCFRGLFNLFFNSYDKAPNDIIEKYFIELLENNKFTLPLILEYDSGSYFPNLFRKKDLFKHFMKHLLAHKIYIPDLYHYFERACDYNEHYPEKGNSLKLVEQYLSKKEGADIISNMVYTLGHSKTDLCSEHSLEDLEDSPETFIKAKNAYEILSDLSFISKNEDKQEEILSILAIGLMQSPINNIGKKENIRNYKKSNSVVIGDPESYVDRIPDCFNDPNKQFEECVRTYNHIKNCNFSERQINKIIETYYSLFDSIWS